MFNHPRKSEWRYPSKKKLMNPETQLRARTRSRWRSLLTLSETFDNVITWLITINCFCLLNSSPPSDMLGKVMACLRMSGELKTLFVISVFWAGSYATNTVLRRRVAAASHQRLITVPFIRVFLRIGTGRSFASGSTSKPSNEGSSSKPTGMSNLVAIENFDVL